MFIISPRLFFLQRFCFFFFLFKVFHFFLLYLFFYNQVYIYVCFHSVFLSLLSPIHLYFRLLRLHLFLFLFLISFHFISILLYHDLLFHFLPLFSVLFHLSILTASYLLMPIFLFSYSTFFSFFLTLMSSFFHFLPLRHLNLILPFISFNSFSQTFLRASNAFRFFLGLSMQLHIILVRADAIILVIPFNSRLYHFATYFLFLVHFSFRHTIFISAQQFASHWSFVFSVQFRCLLFKRTDVLITHLILLHSFFPIFLYLNSLPRRCRLILNLENCTALHIKLPFILSSILSLSLETARMLK